MQFPYKITIGSIQSRMRKKIIIHLNVMSSLGIQLKNHNSNSKNRLAMIFFFLPELNDSKGLKSGLEFEFTDRFSVRMELGREASVKVLKPRCLFHFNRAKLSRLSPRRRSNRSRNSLSHRSFHSIHPFLILFLFLKKKIGEKWKFRDAFLND